MEIYILRHGAAQPRSGHIPEAKRKLTPKGKRDVKRVARRAHAAGVAPDVVLTSPYVRAMATAKTAMKLFKSTPELVEAESLLPGRAPQEVWKEIRSHAPAAQVLVVGHEPQLGALAAYLLRAPNLHVDLKKGAMVAVRMDRVAREPRGELMWMLIPGLCGR